MNERIKQLADKLWEEKYWTNPNTDRLLPAQLNRFAELIVRECAKVADVADENKCEWIGGTILTHFGVEEE